MMIMIHQLQQARKLPLSVAVMLQWMQQEQHFRLGAEVHIVYRRSEAELPARAEEVHHAKEEGIIFDLLTNPIEDQC